MVMDLESRYAVADTVDYILLRGYTKLVLQFPDNMLKDSPAVVKALKRGLGGSGGVKFFVMADTAYNSCCVDEVTASHVDADCVVHYGNACMSLTSKLPSFFVFGKAPLDVNECVKSLSCCMREMKKPILVLYGLEYAYALEDLERSMAQTYTLSNGSSKIHFAKPCSSTMNPAGDKSLQSDVPASNGVCANGRISNHDRDDSTSFGYCSTDVSISKYCLGGITWNLPVDQKMDNIMLFWIGLDNSAFANVVLTYNKCEIVRYDTVERRLYSDASHLKRILKRRYYLIEKAKDASIVGIVVGTLGIAGNLHIIQNMKSLIMGAGKKFYTIVMGRPNPAKLANFPECEVFVYVSCAQTALLDSKDFLAPVITPFEAVLAFSRNQEWTGEYSLDFQNLSTSGSEDVSHSVEEPRFSFIQGHYVNSLEEHEQHLGDSLALVEAMDKSLTIRNQNSDAVLFQGSATSALEYLKARSYQGLTGEYENPAAQSYVTGRSGRAAGYQDEKAKSSH